MEIKIKKSFVKLWLDMNNNAVENMMYHVSVPLHQEYVISDSFGENELIPAEYYIISLPVSELKTPEEADKVILCLRETDDEGKPYLYSAVSKMAVKNEKGDWGRDTQLLAAEEIAKAFTEEENVKA